MPNRYLAAILQKFDHFQELNSQMKTPPYRVLERLYCNMQQLILLFLKNKKKVRTQQYTSKSKIEKKVFSVKTKKKLKI